MKRMADAIDGKNSNQSDYNSNHSGNAPEPKRMRHVDDNHKNIATTGDTVKTLADEKETDSHRLAQRQKQIDYGKNTIGYDRYCAQVSRRQRRPGKHPMTPDKTMRIGKKGFDGIVRKWRQALHKYDPPELAEVTKAMMSDESIAVNKMTETVDADAGAIPSANCKSTTLNESDGKDKILVDSEVSVPSRSIYENFDEDNFDNDSEDSDDDLL